ncbi:MAG TPA: glycogen debranching enzyme N-terminal domain-containing protein [Pyrinomonadaceae bacterium]
MITVDQESCRDINVASTREWLETNGIGGFSSSTIVGLNTRRYHGLLTAATKPPVGRFVLLSKLEETLVIEGQRHELSSNQYPGVVHPRGFEYQVSFRLDPFPTFTYQIEDVRLTKTVFMVYGENTTVVQYELEGKERGKLTLEVRPLIAFRDYHGTTHENGALNPHLETKRGQIGLKPYADLPTLYLAHDPADIDPNGVWYRNFQYQVEQERGLDFAEDLFNPCTLTFQLTAGTRVSIIASTTPVHRSSRTG